MQFTLAGIPFTIDLTQVILGIVVLLLGGGVGWFTAEYRKLKDSKYGPYFKILIGALCDAAEQWYEGPDQGKAKLEWVLTQAAQEAAKLGIPFDAVAVTAVVEDYVTKVINAGQDKTAKG